METDPEREWIRYEDAWEDLRRRERFGWGLFGVVSFLPLIGAALLFCGTAGPAARAAPQVIDGIARLWWILAISLPLGMLAGVAVAHRSVRGFLCPRCGRRFAGLRFWSSWCQHCGLPYDAKGDPDRQTADESRWPDT